MSEAFAYCPFYCEENIWHLCADPRIQATDARVLIISNPERRVAMWGQRISSGPDSPIVWDYHVVLLTRDEAKPWQAWDLDSRNPCPCTAHEWLAASFREAVPPPFAPRFRLVQAADYRRHLRSDRRHMRLPDGSERQPPPSWPPILGEAPPGWDDEGSNLDHFLDTEEPGFVGELLDLRGLRRWLESDAPSRA